MTFTLAGVAKIGSIYRAQKDGTWGDDLMEDLPLTGPPPLTVHQVPIALPPIVISSGSGTLTATGDSGGPPTGFYWSVRRLSVWGFTAGSVIVYRNSPYGLQVVPYPVAATNTFGRGEILLQPDEYMVFVASGITLGTNLYTGFSQPGVLIEGAADLVHWTRLQSYLE